MGGQLMLGTNSKLDATTGSTLVILPTAATQPAQVRPRYLSDLQQDLTTA